MFAEELEQALPVIVVSAHVGLTTAYANDKNWLTGYAQQVYGYGKPGDVLFAVTTSGNSSAPIRADRGGGTVTVAGGTYKASGVGSPAIYSTANITVSKATLSASTSFVFCGSIAPPLCRSWRKACAISCTRVFTVCAWLIPVRTQISSFWAS